MTDPDQSQSGNRRTQAGVVILVVVGVVVLGQLAFTVLTSGEDQSAQSGQTPDEAADSGSASSDSSGAESSPEATSGPPSDMSVLCNINNSEQTEISSEERGAVKSEAEDFVMTMWGDPGSDSDEFRQSMEQRVVKECFWGNSQATLVNDREDIAYEGGRTSAGGGSEAPLFASEFLAFEPTSISPLNEPSNFHPERSGSEYVGVYGDAIWISEKAGGGGKQAFQQSLTLVKPKDGGEWQVTNMGTAYEYIDPEYQDELPPNIDEF